MRSVIPTFWYNSATGVHVPPETAVPCELGEAQTLFAPLTRESSFLGLQVGSEQVVQLLKQADGTWWVERLNTSTVSAQGTHVTTPMAERLLELIFESDLTLVAFCAEFPFLIWEHVRSRPL